MRASRVDANQTRIVEALRKVGCTVQHLHKVGQGCPDLLIGFRGDNILLEIKDGTKSPSLRKLTPQQVGWHANWKGTAHVVKNIEEALSVILS